MQHIDFDRTKHIYRNETFVELVKDAVRFFNGTPVHPLPPKERFYGTGVYALYYIGSSARYRDFARLNRLAYNVPIYVGKAVPKGWRQSRLSDYDGRSSSELYGRLREHSRSITIGEGLELGDFACRFVIFESEGSDMIGTIEAALIKLHRPLWNTVVDGFGNHDPGSGRYAQAKSDWDVLHPGRMWAEKCKGVAKVQSVIESEIEFYFTKLRGDL